VTQRELPDRRRSFTCCGCGTRIAPGRSVPLVGLLVMRRRHVQEQVVAGSPPIWRWTLAPSLATNRYPARACRRCADAWPDKVKRAPSCADATVTA
jgi:hypothetical protein